MNINQERLILELAFCYQKTFDQMLRAMNKYISEHPYTWQQVNWKGIDLNGYFED